MEFYCDNKRHLLCTPYSIANLHKMAAELGIKRCWYHTKPWPHYDIPAKRIDEITAKCNLVSPQRIVQIYRDSLNIK